MEAIARVLKKTSEKKRAAMARYYEGTKKRSSIAEQRGDLFSRSLRATRSYRVTKPLSDAFQSRCESRGITISDGITEAMAIVLALQGDLIYSDLEPLWSFPQNLKAGLSAALACPK
jgi:hypothetical protein